MSRLERMTDVARRFVVDGDVERIASDVEHALSARLLQAITPGTTELRRRNAIWAIAGQLAMNIVDRQMTVPPACVRPMALALVDAFLGGQGQA